MYRFLDDLSFSLSFFLSLFFLSLPLFQLATNSLFQLDNKNWLAVHSILKVLDSDPSNYYRRSTLLNTGDRTKTGAVKAIMRLEHYDKKKRMSLYHNVKQFELSLQL